MPWKLGDDPNQSSKTKSADAEPTVILKVPMPASMKAWLEKRAKRSGGNVAAMIRTMIAHSRARDSSKK